MKNVHKFTSTVAQFSYVQYKENINTVLALHTSVQVYCTCKLAYFEKKSSLQLRGLAAHYCKAMEELASSTGTLKAQAAAMEELQASLVELLGEGRVRRVESSSEAASSSVDLFSSIPMHVLTSAALVHSR